MLDEIRRGWPAWHCMTRLDEARRLGLGSSKRGECEMDGKRMKKEELMSCNEVELERVAKLKISCGITDREARRVLTETETRLDKMR